MWRLPLTVTAQVAAEAIPDLNWVWVGYSANANSVNTGTSGILSVDAQGVYSIESNTAGRIIIEDTEIADLASLVGKFVNIKGYTNGYFEDFDDKNNFIGYTDFLVNTIEEVTFVENPNWTLSYEGSATLANGVAVDIVHNNVSAGDEYFAIAFNSLYAPEDFAAEGLIAKEAMYQTDAIQYYLWQQEPVSENASKVSEDILFRFAELGTYSTVVIGVSEDGYPTGNYATITFTKVETVKDVPYVEDFEKGAQSEGWRFIDADGDGYNWTLKTNTGSSNLSAHSGERLIYSASYYASKALTPDNYAFSPAINLTTANYLSFWVIAQDLSYKAEHYAVYAFEEYPEDGNFEAGEKLFEETFNDKAYKQVIIPLDAKYDNKKVYFAIRHFNCTDMFYLNIDDFAVTEEDPTPAPEEIVPVDVPYAEDFTDGHKGWQFFDLDDDGNGWDLESAELRSYSYVNGSGAVLPDNWAVTPPINFTEGNTLTFSIGSANSSYGEEHYAVYISEKDPQSDATFFTSAQAIHEETISNSNVNLHKISVSIPAAFNNKTAYIAFRHFDCTDQFYIRLDNVSVTEGEPEPDPEPVIVDRSDDWDVEYQPETDTGDPDYPDAVVVTACDAQYFTVKIFNGGIVDSYGIETVLGYCGVEDYISYGIDLLAAYGIVGTSVPYVSSWSELAGAGVLDVIVAAIDPSTGAASGEYCYKAIDFGAAGSSYQTSAYGKKCNTAFDQKQIADFGAWISSKATDTPVSVSASTVTKANSWYFIEPQVFAPKSIPSAGSRK